MPRDVVCLSTQYWDGPSFRKHHFMRHLAARGSRVLYVEPSHSIVRSRNYTGGPGNPVSVSALRRTSDGIAVLTPHRVLPKPNVPAVASLNRKWISRTVLRAAAEAGLERCPVVWVYDVEWAGALDALSPGAVVLDLVDDLVAYEDRVERQQHVERAIQSVVERADLSIFTTAPLQERYASPDHPSVVIPNGFDARRFKEGVGPRRLVEGDRPVIGFVGTLFRHIDYDVLITLADRFRGALVVLVGPDEDGGPGLDALRERANVLSLGRVAPEEVPALVAGFDVCVAPFRAGGVADAVSPLKVYEYLALGRPVVCSPMAGLAQDVVAPLVAFADGREAFAEAVRDALDGRAMPTGWRDVVRGRSWETLSGAAASALDSALGESTDARGATA